MKTLQFLVLFCAMATGLQNSYASGAEVTIVCTASTDSMCTFADENKAQFCALDWYVDNCRLECGRCQAKPSIANASSSCVWVKNNYNTYNEVEADPAASKEACIANVQEKCPTATIANYAVNGNACWCQFGTNMNLEPTAEWENCLISSLEGSGGGEGGEGGEGGSGDIVNSDETPCVGSVNTGKGFCVLEDMCVGDYEVFGDDSICSTSGGEVCCHACQKDNSCEGDGGVGCTSNTGEPMPEDFDCSLITEADGIAKVAKQIYIACLGDLDNSIADCAPAKVAYEMAKAALAWISSNQAGEGGDGGEGGEGGEGAGVSDGDASPADSLGYTDYDEVMMIYMGLAGGYDDTDTAYDSSSQWETAHDLFKNFTENGFGDDDDETDAYKDAYADQMSSYGRCMHKTVQTCGDEFENCYVVARLTASEEDTTPSCSTMERDMSEAQCLSLAGCEYNPLGYCYLDGDDYIERFTTLCPCLSSKCQNVHDACVLGQHVAREKLIGVLVSEKESRPTSSPTMSPTVYYGTTTQITDSGGDRGRRTHGGGPGDSDEDRRDEDPEEMRKEINDMRDAQLCSVKTEADDGIHDVLLLELKITLTLILHCEHELMKEMGGDASERSDKFKGFTCDTKNTEKDVEIIKQMLKAIKGGMSGKEQLKVLAAMKKQGGFATFLNDGHKGKLDLDVDMVAIIKELLESKTGGQLVLAELKKAGIAMKDIAAATGLTEAALTAAASSPIGDVIDSSAAAVTVSLAVVAAAAASMFL